MKRTILTLTLLAGCDEAQGDPGPTERQRCVEYLACFDECLWEPPEYHDGVLQPPPLPLNCRHRCDLNLDMPLTWAEGDLVEDAERDAWSGWHQLFQQDLSDCPPGEDWCVEAYQNTVNDFRTAFEDAKRMRAGICADKEDE